MRRRPAGRCRRVRGRRAWRALGPALVWTAIIAFVATRPPDALPFDFFRSLGVPPGLLGHVYHAGAFLVLAVLGWLGLQRARIATRAPGRSLLALAGAVGVSVAVECLQFATPPRTPQLSDVAVNLVGSVLGVGLMELQAGWAGLGARLAAPGVPVSGSRRRS